MDQHSQWLIRGLRAGDSLAVGEFCRRYGDRLERVARGKMVDGLHRRFGPDDVAQSVCRTFVRRMQGGQFTLDGSESLWRLLCAITLTKVRAGARHHLRQKRGLDREVHLPASSRDEGGGAFQPAAPDPTPAEIVEFADELDHLLAGLEEEDRRVVDLKLQQHDNAEIAEALGCSERTVRRILARLQEQFEKALGVA
jgi:RNA polymerase sigma factor (sigma-70 family)